jgi:hypothetical protein
MRQLDGLGMRAGYHYSVLKDELLPVLINVEIKPFIMTTMMTRYA